MKKNTQSFHTEATAKAVNLNEPLSANKKRDMIVGFSLLVLMFVVLSILEHVLPATSMLFTVLKKGAIYALVAVSMNLLNGFTGLFSLGQAGFMMIGAYTYAIFTIPVAQRAAVYQYFNGGIIQFTLPVIIAMILAGLAAALFAFLIGLPVLHLKSDYLAIATLGFAEILRAVFQWDKLGVVTNGSNLLRKYAIFKSVLFPFAVSGVCIAIIVLLINSTYGRAFKAIRDDEVAAEAMGINLAHHKLLAFVISSFFAGISGALLAMFQTTIQASQFKSAMTYEILLIVVIGGIGSVTGSCISSFLFIACSEWWLRFLDNANTYIGTFHVPLLRPGFRKVVFSIVIMLIVLFYQKGIMGEREFSIARLLKFFKSIPQKFKRHTVTASANNGTSASEAACENEAQAAVEPEDTKK
jgi:branched-chain amino acid transport system permease protein